MNCTQLLYQSASRKRHTPALLMGSEMISFQELVRRCAAFAATLQHEYKLQPEDRVLVTIDHSIEQLIRLWGCWHAGVTTLLIPSNEIDSSLFQQASFQPIQCWLDTAANKKHHHMVLQHQIPYHPQEALTVKHWGATQTRPEPCESYDVAASIINMQHPEHCFTQSHQNLLAYCSSCLADLVQSYSQPIVDLQIADPIISALLTFPLLVAGVTTRLPLPHNRQQSVETDAILFIDLDQLEQMSNLDLKQTGVAYSVIISFTNQPLSPSPRVNQQLGKKMRNVFAPLACGTCATINHPIDTETVSNQRYDQKLIPLGQACFGMEVAVFGENGQQLPSSEIGELWFRGHSVSPGFLDSYIYEEGLFHEGWYRSGLYGLMMPDGRLYFDRSLTLSGIRPPHSAPRQQSFVSSCLN
jgi:acyl-CoA synthetase (AMP-forming)/AMP-acid ligase II